MRDIPVFTTEYGVASLTLKEIPYRAEAYIRIQSAFDANSLLNLCCDFCRAAGAERIYATGHSVLDDYPLHTSVIRMSCNRATVPDTEALLVSVQEKTLSQWRMLYNEGMKDVPNASYMTLEDAQKMLDRGVGYFIKRSDELLGIGIVSGDTIEAIVSAFPGAGKDVLAALCSKITSDTVYLEVSTANKKAVQFYNRHGFALVSKLSTWYSIK